MRRPTRVRAALSALSALSTTAATTHAVAQVVDRLTSVPRFAVSDERSRGRNESERALVERTLQDCATRLHEHFREVAPTPTWLYWRRNDGRSPVRIVDGSDLRENDHSEVHGSFAISRFWSETSRSLVNRWGIHFAHTVPGQFSERREQIECHELFHSLHVMRTALRANAEAHAVLQTMPTWILHGAPQAAVWVVERQPSGETPNLDQGSLATTAEPNAQLDAQGRQPGVEMRFLFGMRSYEDSLAIDAFGGSTEHAVDGGYRTGAFHAYAMIHTGYTPWQWLEELSNPSLGGSVQSRSWVTALNDRITHRFAHREDDHSNTREQERPKAGLPSSLGELFARFITYYAEYPWRDRERPLRGPFFEQDVWLRQFFPLGGQSNGCERVRLQHTNSDAYAERAYRNVRPLSARCMRLEFNGERSTRASNVEFEVNVTSSAGTMSRSDREKLCESLRIGFNGGSLTKFTLSTRDATSCVSMAHFTLDRAAPRPPTLVVSYAPTELASARTADFSVRLAAPYGRVSRSPSGGSPKQAAAPSAPVSFGAVIHHDTEPPSCDPRWELFCGPRSHIYVPADEASAGMLGGYYAYPPTMLVQLPDLDGPSVVAGLALSGLAPRTLTLGPGSNFRGANISLPRITPGFTGVVRDAIVHFGDESSYGPSATAVDERCDRRRFPSSATVTILRNVGAELSGTFEATLYRDPPRGANGDRDCVRTRIRSGTIRGEFATAALGSGYLFDEAHRDVPRRAGLVGTPEYDMPQAWLQRAQIDARLPNRHASAQGAAQPANTATNNEADDTRTVVSMVGAGARALAAAPTSGQACCDCSCEQRSTPAWRSYCEGECQAAFSTLSNVLCTAIATAPPSTPAALCDAGVDVEFEAILSRLPASAAARLRRQIDQQPGAVRSTMRRTMVPMLRSMLPRMR
ncbi:MAG: hypothetical protein JNK05_28875 [Myxococcales bacterium]|nr:hypothetical protein [Myxococcales bacterium]